MELTDLESQRLQQDQHILELKESAPFSALMERIRATVTRLEQSFLQTKLTDFDQYLSYWYQRQTLLSLLGELDAIEREVRELTNKAAQVMDDSPATGELA